MEWPKLQEKLSPRNIGRVVVGAIASIPEKYGSQGERGVWFIPALEAEQIAIFTDPSTWETDQDLAQELREKMDNQREEAGSASADRSQ